MNHDPPSSDSTTSNTQNSSTKLHDQPLPSYQQRYFAQTATPQYQKIISDKETKEFLDSYFSVSTSKTLNAEVFFDLLVHEFAQRNPDLTHQIEEDEFFKGELRKLLLDRLTINHEDTVSFDALEMSTKKNGLYGFLVDMALEADAHSKLKKSMQNSDISVGELNVSNKMLNTKKEELMIYEQKLKEYEMSLMERERVMKQALQFEYERLVKSFEENYLDKVNNIMKRLMSHEKSTKLKIKQFETQVKEIKAANTGNTVSISQVGDEKSKYKVSSLEKSNDFLKNKLQEVERKLVEEQEAASKKNRTLMKKIAVLEKSVKELGGDLTVITTGKVTQQVHAESEPTSLQKLDDSEKTDKRGRSISPPQNAAEENNNDNNDNEEEDNNILKKTDKLLTKKSVIKTGVLIESSPVSAVGKKKVTTVKTGQSSEFKVLLNVVHSLIVCLKSTLPIFAGNSEGNKRSRKGSIELGKENRDIEHEHPLDLGEIFYPCFDSLIGNLTELIPLLGKQYDAKYISSIIEIYYRLINFFFKFKVLKRFDQVEAENRLLSEFDIQNSTNKIKTSQDHINEIMVPSQIPKESGDVHFVPQTEYWKKLVKLAKPFQNSKTGIDPFAKENKPFKAKSDFVHIHLYTEEVIQKEVLSVLRKYLDTTEFMLKTNAAAATATATTNTEKEGEKSSEVISVMSFHATLNLETQKYLQITRLYSSLVAILLARTKKEQVLGLQALAVDLNVENVKFAEFLRLFLMENEGLDIVFWVLKTRIEDMEILQAATNILCSLNCEGAHYKLFSETLTKEENVQIVSELVSKYQTNSEYYNKWTSIIRNLTETESIPAGCSERYANLLKLIG